MKVALTEGPGAGFVVQDIDLDEPLGKEVLVEVRASGLCHSDLHIASEGFGFNFPAVLGHEIAGVVVDVGPDVTDFRPGDHVAGCLIQFCGHCDSCLSGRVYQCWNPDETQRPVGAKPRLSRNGKEIVQYSALSGFAERALIHQNQLARVPDEVPFSRAAILGCGVITGAGAVLNTADIAVGDAVVVIGCGGVGLNAIQGARLAGAGTIIAVDLQPAKLDLALKFGATHTVNSGQMDALEAVRAITPRGVRHAFEVIGLKQTCQLAVDVVGVGGNIYVIGLQKPGSTIEMKAWEDLVIGQKKLHGVQMGSTNPKHDIPMYAEMYLAGRFNLDDLVSKEIGLDDISAAYAELERGEIARTIITSF